MDAVQGKMPVHVGGGIRYGTNILKALAPGADLVWIGRPVLWGLSYKGQEVVGICLCLPRDELTLCMGLAGTIKIPEISKDYLMKTQKAGFVSRL